MILPFGKLPFGNILSSEFSLPIFLGFKYLNLYFYIK